MGNVGVVTHWHPPKTQKPVYAPIVSVNIQTLWSILLQNVDALKI